MEKEYWEARYSRGSSSGKGSFGQWRTWKWSVVMEHVGELDSFADIGCGDLSFWEGRDCENYIGIDISCNIITKNRLKKPKWKFICANARDKIQEIKGRVVFCFDVLFHIMNTDDFVKILENLCTYSDEWIFIYTWSKNPFGGAQGEIVSDEKFQYYRSLHEHVGIFKKNGFKLVETRWPPWGGIGELFVFKKVDITPSARAQWGNGS